jgi:plastocyanin
MDRDALRAIMIQLNSSRSRRQVLATVAKGSLGGAGAALIGRGLGNGLLDGRLVPGAQAQATMVSIEDFQFNPPTIEITAGSEVTWTNNGPSPHTATADDGSTFDSGRLDPGGTFSHTFDTAGDFPYHCDFHPDMTGTVTVVEEQPTTYSTPTTEPTATTVPTDKYVRRNVHGLDPAGPELTAYANAVEAMQALPNTDPLSWAYQGNIHATWLTPPAPEPPPTSELPGWSTCEHGNLYFWPWHRMYLYWFEQIIREMSGDATFALPYWDYFDPGQRVLPAPFRDPASPLYNDERNPGINSETPPGANIDSQFDHCVGLSADTFNFASRRPSGIEGRPHDAVHIWVGGWMSAFETAARDPIFWLHHSNIDRLWESWVQLGHVSEPDPPDPAWATNDVHSITGQPYTFFDKTGTEVTTFRVVNEVLDLPTLGYEYEALATLAGCPEFLTAPLGGAEAAGATPAATPEEPRELGSATPEGGIEVGPEPVSVPVEVAQPEAAAEIAQAGGATVLTLEGVQGTGAAEAVAVEVYINLPPGQEPDFRSPYFVGNLSLFGLLDPDAEHPEMAMPLMTQQFNISRNVAALEQTGEWTGELRVTLVPYYLAATGVPEAAGATPEAGATPAAAAPPPGPWVTVESVSLSAG